MILSIIRERVPPRLVCIRVAAENLVLVARLEVEDPNLFQSGDRREFFGLDFVFKAFLVPLLLLETVFMLRHIIHVSNHRYVHALVSVLLPHGGQGDIASDLINSLIKSGNLVVEKFTVLLRIIIEDSRQEAVDAVQMMFLVFFRQKVRLLHPICLHLWHLRLFHADAFAAELARNGLHSVRITLTVVNNRCSPQAVLRGDSLRAPLCRSSIAVGVVDGAGLNLNTWLLAISRKAKLRDVMLKRTPISAIIVFLQEGAEVDRWLGVLAPLPCNRRNLRHELVKLELVFLRDVHWRSWLDLIWCLGWIIRFVRLFDVCGQFIENLLNLKVFLDSTGQCSELIDEDGVESYSFLAQGLCEIPKLLLSLLIN